MEKNKQTLFKMEQIKTSYSSVVSVCLVLPACAQNFPLYSAILVLKQDC